MKQFGKWYKKENERPNGELKIGVCDLYGEEKTSPFITSTLIKNIGFKSVRLWMHCSWLMSSPTLMRKDKCERAHEVIKGYKESGIQVVGMNHHGFCLGNDGYYFTSGKIPYGNGQEYKKFLADYQTTWYNLAKEFREVDFWEIHNESNSDTFLKKLDGNLFSQKEKAIVFADMMFYASQGIHNANPKATTVMGGLVAYFEDYAPDKLTTDFLQYIYDYIYSGSAPSKYPDDYFQAIAWHPYFFSNYEDSFFEEYNKNLYGVILKNERKDKKVFFTEYGWNLKETTYENIEKWLPKFIKTTAEKLTFVESIHFFRMYDVLCGTWGGEGEKTHGLFTDPEHYETLDGRYKHEKLGYPKSTAFIMQKLAGGNGKIDNFEQLKGLI